MKPIMDTLGNRDLLWLALAAASQVTLRTMHGCFYILAAVPPEKAMFPICRLQSKMYCMY